jgi:hypothetical protein
LATFRNEWKRELIEHDRNKQVEDNQTTTTSISNRANSNLKSSNQFTLRVRTNNLTIDDTNLNEQSEVEYDQPRSNEEKAQYLFNKAVLLEEQSRHYEAIKFYRLAMQLDADIEFKVAQQRKLNDANKQNLSNKNKSTGGKDSEGETEEDDESETINQTDNSGVDIVKSLYEQFHSMTISENRTCEKNYVQKVIELFFLN